MKDGCEVSERCVSEKGERFSKKGGMRGLLWTKNVLCQS